MTLGHILWEMFNWPSGNVIGNLTASTLSFTAGFILGRKWLQERFTGLHVRFGEVHEKLDSLHQKFDSR